MTLDEAVCEVLARHPGRIIISNPDRSTRLRRAVLRVADAAEGSYHAEEFTATQTFHHEVDEGDLTPYVLRLMEEGLRQLNAEGCQVRLSAKGRVLASIPPVSSRHETPESPDATQAKTQVAHDRPRNRLLDLSSDVPPLVDMGVITESGQVVASMGDKYRQIERFVELLDDGLKDYDRTTIDIIDFGCGKSYLTFVIYHYLTSIRGLDVHMVGLDLKDDVIALCNKTARRYGYDGLRFEKGDIGGYVCTTPPDLVISLHACDTATDLALFNAVRWGTGLIYSVPCCQHELNAQMGSEQLSLLTRYGIIKERSAALITDALRADLLEACGYRTQVLEFVDLSHTPKNLLIRAKKVQRPEAVSRQIRREMLDEVDAACSEFHLTPKLRKLLEEADLL